MEQITNMNMFYSLLYWRRYLCRASYLGGFLFVSATSFLCASLCFNFFLAAVWFCDRMWFTVVLLLRGVTLQQFVREILTSTFWTTNPRLSTCECSYSTQVCYELWGSITLVNKVVHGSTICTKRKVHVHFMVVNVAENNCKQTCCVLQRCCFALLSIVALFHFWHLIAHQPDLAGL